MIIPFNKNFKETRFLNQWIPFSAISLIAIVISYFLFDIPLATYFKNIAPASASFADFWTDLIDPKLQYFIWPILYFLFFFIWRRKYLANRFLLIWISIALTNAVIELLKRILGRARPELLWSHQIFGFQFFENQNTDFSFPSGHACTIGALMGAIACFYPKHSYTCLSIALVLAFTRVILSFHYLSDIIAGVAIGILISQWVYRVMKTESVQFKLK